MKLFDVFLPPTIVVLAMADSVAGMLSRLEEMTRLLKMSVSVSAAILRETPASKWRRKMTVEA
ncbi:hypothetical protein N7490_004133 [Penicillium lividum]|nr:hypothetical protein N7490_004133 [Penicillium lividum]